MTALGSEFAMLLLVSGNWAAIGKLEKALNKLSDDQPLSISLRKTDERVSADTRDLAAPPGRVGAVGFEERAELRAEALVLGPVG